jgi:hypothetical protein
VSSYLSEMEVISKEFESTMEQNTRLLHELSDKDETTTKLMSDVRLRLTRVRRGKEI